MILICESCIVENTHTMAENSILDYARIHGLAKDHTEFDLTKTLAFCSPSSFKELELDQSLDISKFPNSVLESTKRIPETVNSFLSEATAEPSSLSFKDFPLDFQTKPNLKLELPLLQSNNNRDLAQFRARPTASQLLQPLKTVSWKNDKENANEIEKEVMLNFSLVHQDMYNSITKDKIRIKKDRLTYLSKILHRQNIEKSSTTGVQSSTVPGSDQGVTISH